MPLPCVASNLFEYNSTNRTFVGEVSRFGPLFNMFTKLSPNEEAFELVSSRTGKHLTFVFDERDDDYNGDTLRYWFKSKSLEGDENLPKNLWVVFINE